MKQVIRGFVGRINELKRVKKILLVVSLLVAIIVGKIFTAQFVYTEIGYKPVVTDEGFRNALSVSPFTATNFANGYTYEYEGKWL